MPRTVSYNDRHKLEIVELTRKIVSELPNSVYDYILAISDTTQPLTRYAYSYDLRLFLNYLQKENPRFSSKELIAWTDQDFENVSVRDITMFLDYLSLYFNEDDEMVSNQNVGKQRKFYSVRSFFKWMYKQGRIKSDVTALVDAPKRHEKPILRLDSEEVKKMLSIAANGETMSARQQKYHTLTAARDLAMISLFLGTGIRVSECAGLDIDDINLDDKSFLVTRKGGNQVILYMPDEIIPALKDYMDIRIHADTADENERALFLSLQKRRMNVRTIENMVKKYAAAAAPLKKRISPHKLRSTFGTNLYNETGDIYLVADVLGHSDINTTRKHYAAMSEDRRKYAATKVRLSDNTNAETEETGERSD
ncbi:MAG: tyrosine-type recombinase/integrase [Clostridia bacterium]|nr:tyrosine-type recombinase/integrase [Clostridia bacterium]